MMNCLIYFWIFLNERNQLSQSILLYYIYWYFVLMLCPVGFDLEGIMPTI